MRNRVIIQFLLFILALSALRGQDTPSAVMPEKHFDILDKYCLSCHDADTEKAGVNLEDLGFQMDTLPSAELWQKVLNAMNSGEMPPEDKKQLNDVEKTTFLSDLSNQLVTAREVLSDSGGVITMRRLNRREYQNTIRDLLGVEVNVADLPDDTSSDGFDTTGASLFFSSDQFEQYLKIGRQALDLALVSGAKPKVRKLRVETELAATKFIKKQADGHLEDHQRAEAWRKSGKPPTEFGFIDEARVDFEDGNYKRWWPTFNQYLQDPRSQDGTLLYNWFRGPGYATLTISNKMPLGKYRVRARVGALKDSPENRRFVELVGMDVGTGLVLECAKITGTREDPSVAEFLVNVSTDEERKLGIRERQHNTPGQSRANFIKTQRATGFGPMPSLWVDWMEVEGPILEEWPPKPQQQLLFKGPKAEETNAYAREILHKFAKRAFRDKEPTDAFLDKLMTFYKANKRPKVTMTEALKEPLSIILTSPNFLYLREPNGPKKRRQLTQKELAVRLSYFLWSGPPDEELFQLAKDETLTDSEVLWKQVHRMLRDPRAWEFISSFTHQWLHMERLDFFQFNHQLYPEFDESLKEAAREEVYRTFQTMLTENLAIGNLLNSDFVLANDLLAQFYGLNGVEGAEFRKVDVPPGVPRGGLLGMAAILAMGSDGERSSPVERGSWILRKVLHDPPPPAPPNVPQLSRLDGKVLSPRQMQDAHMEEPQCAQCHQKIDPLGFGLENFDAAGQWRESVAVKGKVKNKKGKKVNVTQEFPVDPTGTMPDGAGFSDFFQMRDQIARHEDAFARGFVEALIEYGLGRPYGFTDQSLADKILAGAKEKGYSTRVFINRLVTSKEFRRK